MLGTKTTAPASMRAAAAAALVAGMFVCCFFLAGQYVGQSCALIQCVHTGRESERSWLMRCGWCGCVTAFEDDGVVDRVYQKAERTTLDDGIFLERMENWLLVE
ncbi:hypothetical protein KCV04_g34, partial [Aureobasidium melanogenum]